jgi:hypothetical protein
MKKLRTRRKRDKALGTLTQFQEFYEAVWRHLVCDNPGFLPVAVRHLLGREKRQHLYHRGHRGHRGEQDAGEFATEAPRRSRLPANRKLRAAAGDTIGKTLYFHLRHARYLNHVRPQLDFCGALCKCSGPSGGYRCRHSDRY